MLILVSLLTCLLINLLQSELGLFSTTYCEYLDKCFFWTWLTRHLKCKKKNVVTNSYRLDFLESIPVYNSASLKSSNFLLLTFVIGFSGNIWERNATEKCMEQEVMFRMIACGYSKFKERHLSATLVMY